MSIFNKILTKKNVADVAVNYLQQNLKFLVKKFNIDNESLAKYTGLSNATIASLRSRANNPTVQTLKPLAEFFNLTIDQLVYQDCSNLCSINTNINREQTENILLPIIDLMDVIHWPFDILDNSLNARYQYVTTSGKINNYCYAVRLDSEILMPYYQKNAILIIDPNKETKDSNIVLLSLNANNPSPTFRQVFIDAGSYYFKPVNSTFGGMQTAVDCKIYGVLVRAIFDVP